MICQQSILLLFMKNLKIYLYILAKKSTRCSIKINTTPSRRNDEEFLSERIQRKVAKRSDGRSEIMSG